MDGVSAGDGDKGESVPCSLVRLCKVDVTSQVSVLRRGPDMNSEVVLCPEMERWGGARKKIKLTSAMGFKKTGVLASWKPMEERGVVG